MNKESKNHRILDIYIRLCEGKHINKIEEAERHKVDERTIQRDIDDIRAFLSDKSMTNSLTGKSIVYDRTKKGFILIGEENSFMSNGEILAISKILLESRAFTRNEICDILNKLILGCASKEDRKLISNLIANEQYHYVELHHKSYAQDNLWKIGTSIKQCELVEITYDKLLPSKETVKRIVKPLAILFSEYYFYLNAYIVEKKKNTYVQIYNYPAIFRIDRIKTYKEIGEKFRIPYANRFEEGEFRKRVQFMYAGELMKIQFKYTGKSVEAILDRLPTAVIIRQKEGEYVIEAEVYGKGILMWLFSQGNTVEVLKPKKLREEIKNILSDALKKYQ